MAVRAKKAKRKKKSTTRKTKKKAKRKTPLKRLSPKSKKKTSKKKKTTPKKKPVRAKKKTAKKKSSKKKTAPKRSAKKKINRRKTTPRKETSRLRPKKSVKTKSGKPFPTATEVFPSVSQSRSVPSVPLEERVGVITHYFGHLGVAVVRLDRGQIKIGDTIHIKGHTSDFRQQIDTMEVEHRRIFQASAGEEFGLKVVDSVREHDEVFRVG